MPAYNKRLGGQVEMASNQRDFSRNKDNPVKRRRIVIARPAKQAVAISDPIKIFLKGQ